MSALAHPLSLQAQPLTAEAFSPFGQLIQTEGARHFPMNAGAQERYYDLAEIEIAGEAARPVISIAETRQVASLPYSIPLVERHPLGSQAFIPLDDHPQLIVVAPIGDFGLSGLRAFYSEGRQGVNYARGVWHMPMIALAAGQRWLIVDRAGSGHNCDEILLEASPVVVTR